MSDEVSLSAVARLRVTLDARDPATLSDRLVAAAGYGAAVDADQAISVHDPYWRRRPFVSSGNVKEVTAARASAGPPLATRRGVAAAVRRLPQRSMWRCRLSRGQRRGAQPGAILPQMRRSIVGKPSPGFVPWVSSPAMAAVVPAATHRDRQGDGDDPHRRRDRCTGGRLRSRQSRRAAGAADEASILPGLIVPRQTVRLNRRLLRHRLA
jgi:hypothetical protein